MAQTELSRERQASNFMGELIRGGWINTVLDPFDERSSRKKYLEWFAKIYPAKRVRQDPRQFELAMDAQSQRWQENRLPPLVMPSLLNYWAIEISRFVVPEGHIGYIRTIEQELMSSDATYFPTNVAYWGSPTYGITDVDNIEWYLTVSPYEGTQPPRHNVASLAPIQPHNLPGQPFGDLPLIQGIYYPVNNNKKLKMLVPGRSMLRFFMLTPPTITYLWHVSGKLSGYTQSTYQNCAVSNARSVY
jgi:hypothetical protein